MQKYYPPATVSFFFSLLFNEKIHSKEKLIDSLANRFGGGESFICDDFPMRDYYAKEMGNATDLQRFWYFCETKSERQNLIKIKHICIEWEQSELVNDRRSLNIDPGYYGLEQVVLATHKPYSHRLYLGDNVYGELTYQYIGKNGYVTLPWTYPDYTQSRVIREFNRQRDQLKKER